MPSLGSTSHGGAGRCPDPAGFLAQEAPGTVRKQPLADDSLRRFIDLGVVAAALGPARPVELLAEHRPRLACRLDGHGQGVGVVVHPIPHTREEKT